MGSCCTKSSATEKDQELELPPFDIVSENPITKVGAPKGDSTSSESGNDTPRPTVPAAPKATVPAAPKATVPPATVPPATVHFESAPEKEGKPPVKKGTPRPQLKTHSSSDDDPWTAV
jgi:hypothetical protein